MLYFYFFARSLQNLILGEFRRSGRSNKRHTFGFPLPTDERAKIFQSCGFAPGCASSVASPSLSKKDRTPNWQSPGSVCGRTRSFSPEGLRAPHNAPGVASQLFLPFIGAHGGRKVRRDFLPVGSTQNGFSVIRGRKGSHLAGLTAWN
ncbi:hypothetical protein ILYODFUR_008222 [Ilyodon furcidens]|uniref:Uncharacterized protein n=1 Tax=Ilyodon furcidens TaxID=33524 RepID=A0ABV0V1C4_9TELE